jgi:uncharacterized protein YciI
MTRAILLLVLAVTGTWLFHLAQAEATPKYETRVVFIVHPGPANPPGRSLFDAPGMRDHGAHMTKLFADGKLTSAGPFSDGTGGIGIAARDLTLEQVTALLADDPAAKSGLITYEIKTWTVRLGAL